MSLDVSGRRVHPRALVWVSRSQDLGGKKHKASEPCALRLLCRTCRVGNISRTCLGGNGAASSRGWQIVETEDLVDSLVLDILDCAVLDGVHRGASC